MEQVGKEPFATVTGNSEVIVVPAVVIVVRHVCPSEILPGTYIPVCTCTSSERPVSGWLLFEPCISQGDLDTDQPRAIHGRCFVCVVIMLTGWLVGSCCSGGEYSPLYGHGHHGACPRGAGVFHSAVTQCVMRNPGQSISLKLDDKHVNL